MSIKRCLLFTLFLTPLFAFEARDVDSGAIIVFDHEKEPKIGELRSIYDGETGNYHKVEIMEIERSLYGRVTIEVYDGELGAFRLFEQVEPAKSEQ